MINIRATRIDQSFSLENGAMQNFLIVTLPDGSELRAPITDEQVEQLVKEVSGTNGAGVAHDMVGLGEEVVTPWNGKTPTYPDPPVQTIGAESPEQDEVNAQALFNQLQEEAEPEPTGELINWGALPNEMLTVTMKAAFRLLGAAPQMSYADVQQLSSNIADTFGEEDWAKVRASLAPAQAAPPKPPIGQVQWADGSPMVAGSKPARTVPKDAAGYPVVDNEVDPGEIVVTGSDSDEDGVSQL